MTRLTVETNDVWTKRKIESLIFCEAEILRRAICNIQQKIQDFEHKYGNSDSDSLYGKVDDMEVLEWEGEIETMLRLQKKLKSFEEITFEYK